MAGSADVREELSELLTRPEHAVPGRVPGRIQRRDLLPPRLLTGRPRTGARWFSPPEAAPEQLLDLSAAVPRLAVTVADLGQPPASCQPHYGLRGHPEQERHLAARVSRSSSAWSLVIPAAPHCPGTGNGRRAGRAARRSHRLGSDPGRAGRMPRSRRNGTGHTGAGVPAAKGLRVAAGQVRGASLISSELDDGTGVAGSPAQSHQAGSGVPGSRTSGQVR